MNTLTRICDAAFSKPWKTAGESFPRFGKLLAAGLLASALLTRAEPEGQTGWPVAGATIRCMVEITTAPSSPEAGVVAIIPDGGLLPRPAPDPVVFDANGKPLKSEVLWFNPRDGIAVIFEPPDTGTATIYFRPAGSFAHVGNRPTSLFKASLVLLVKMGRASLNTALQIPAEAWQGGVRMGLAPYIGQCENLLGPEEDYSSYYVGWIKPAKTARVYICTISSDGSECRLDGKVVASWPGTHSRKEGAGGKFGSWVELSAGLHRVEYFHFKKADDNAEANLCWRWPGDKLPHTLTVQDYVQSGQAQMRSFETPERTPTAALLWSCESYLWLRNAPWNLFTCRALPAANAPTNMLYTWEPEPGLRVTGPELNWIFSGSAERTVGLTTTRDKASRRGARAVYPSQTPARATINAPSDRQAYRKALLARCQTVPVPQRPCANWDEELWSIFMGVVEPLAGLSVMREVFERSWNDVLRRPVAERYRLEDFYFDLMRYSDKKAAEDWLTRFEAADSTNRERQVHWQLKRLDFVLNDLQQPDVARKLAHALQERLTSSNEMARLLIRRGDVERHVGNTEAAAKLYGDAQNALGKKTAGVGKTVAAPASAPATSAGPRTRGGKEPRMFAIAPAVDDWRKQAVREAAYYEQLHSQLQARDIEEAQKTLETWEVEFPLSKLAGDYPLGEGEFYTTIGDFPRALRVLALYRKHVEISNYLPQAMALESRCLLALKRTAEFKTLAQELVARFPGHPAARDIQTELDLLNARSKGGRVLRLEDFQ